MVTASLTIFSDNTNDMYVWSAPDKAIDMLDLPMSVSSYTSG